MFRVPLGTYLVTVLAIVLVIAGTGTTIIATMMMGKMPGIMSDANEANRTREGIAISNNQQRESTIDTPSQVSFTSYPARIGAFTIPRAGAFGIGLAPGARTPLRHAFVDVFSSIIHPSDR
jgi:hypothetical protein